MENFDETGIYNEQPLLIDLSCISSKIRALSPLIKLMPGIAQNEAVFKAYWCHYARDYEKRPRQVLRRRLEQSSVLMDRIKLRNPDDMNASMLDLLAKIKDMSVVDEPITTIYEEFLKCVYRNPSIKPRKRSIVPDLRTLQLKEFEIRNALKGTRNPYEIQNLKEKLDRIRQISLPHHTSPDVGQIKQIQQIHPSPRIGHKLFKGHTSNMSPILTSSYQQQEKKDSIRNKYSNVNNYIEAPSGGSQSEVRKYNIPKLAKKEQNQRTEGRRQESVKKLRSNEKSYESTKDVDIPRTNNITSRRNSKDLRSKHNENNSSLASEIIPITKSRNREKPIKVLPEDLQEKIKKNNGKQPIPKNKKTHKSRHHKFKELSANENKFDKSISSIYKPHRKKLSHKFKETSLGSINSLNTTFAINPKTVKKASRRSKNQKQNQDQIISEVKYSKKKLSFSDKKENLGPEIVLNKKKIKEIIDRQAKLESRMETMSEDNDSRTDSIYSNKEAKKREKLTKREKLEERERLQEMEKLKKTEEKGSKYSLFKFKDKKDVKMKKFYKKIEKGNESLRKGYLPQNSVLRANLLKTQSPKNLRRHSSIISLTDSVKYFEAKPTGNQEQYRKFSVTSASSDMSHNQGWTVFNVDSPKDQSIEMPKLVDKLIKSPKVEGIHKQFLPILDNSSTSAKDISEGATSRSDSKSSIEAEITCKPCAICRQLEKPPLQPYMQQMLRQRKKLELRAYYRQMMLRNCRQKKELEERKSLEQQWKHCEILNDPFKIMHCPSRISAFHHFNM